MQRRAAAPWRDWRSVITKLMAATQSPDADTLFTSAPQLRAQLVQLQTTLPQQMNKPAFLLKPLGSSLRQSTTQKKLVTSIQKRFHKQLLDSLTTSPVDRAILLSQPAPHTGAHLTQPNSEAYEAEDRFFLFLCPGDSCYHILQPLTPQVLLWHAPTKVQRVNSVANLWTCNSTIAMGAGMEVALTAGMRSGQMPCRCNTLTQRH